MRQAYWLMPLVLAGNVAQAAEVAPAVAEAVGEQPKFDVLDFQIAGNTVLDDETLERTVYPFMGPGKSVDDMEKARQALEEAYRKAGYPTVVVSIPEQDVKEGAVQLDVTEGTIENLHIVGSRYYALGKIREGVPALAEGKVPHMPDVQAQVGVLAEQSSDRNITPIFRAGSTPGKMEVELRVKDELPVHGSVEINSRNSENTTLTRVVGSLRYDNLWQRFHSASLQYQTSPENPDEVEVWAGTYVLPTGWADTRFAFYGIGISSSTNLNLGTSIGGASVLGAGSIYGARLVKPFAGSGDFMHNLSLGFDYKSFDQTITLAGLDNQPVTYASFLLGYDSSWRGEGRVTSLNLGAHFSFRGMGNDAKEFEAKRNDATPNFLYLTADVKHQQQLPLDFRLQGRASGQASSARLISNEQFAAGGPLSVRGYHQTQQLGDHGVNLSLELHSPQLLPTTWDAVQNFRALGFVDWAGLWTNDPLPPTEAYTELASAGLGLRMQVFKHLNGELDWGYPFYRQGTVEPGQQRIDFKMAYEF